MKVEKADSKTDVFVKISLFFFVALLSFSIGIFVGKKFSDNQHKLAQLEPNKKGEAHQSSSAKTSDHGEEHTTATAPATEMTDEEISKLAEEFVEEESPLPVAKKTDATESKDTHEEAHAAAAHAETHEKAAPAKSAHTVERSTASIPPAAKEESIHEVKEAHQAKDTLKEASKQVANNKLPEVKSEPNTASVTAGGAKLPENVNYDSLGKYTIQVGSYNKEEDAKKAAEDLKKKGYAAFYLPAKVKDQSWFRVSVGLFATQKEAVDYKKTLMDTRSVQSAIVQKIVN